jgi:hypothetical protein
MILILCDNIHWGDIATWVTGIFTIGLFIVGFNQIRIERNRRIQEQIRKIKLEHEQQALLISSWVSEENGDHTIITILNHSDEPIYKVILSIVNIKGRNAWGGKKIPNELRACISIVPPGKYYAKVGTGYNGMNFRPGIEIAFIDKKGDCWIKNGDGKIEEIKQFPNEYYDIPLPIGWTLPKDKID